MLGHEGKVKEDAEDHDEADGGVDDGPLVSVLDTQPLRESVQGRLTVFVLIYFFCEGDKRNTPSHDKLFFRHKSGTHVRRRVCIYVGDLHSKVYLGVLIVASKALYEKKKIKAKCLRYPPRFPFPFFYLNGPPAHLVPDPVLFLVDHISQHRLEGVLEHGQRAEPTPPDRDRVVTDEETAEKEHEGQQRSSCAVALGFP